MRSASFFTIVSGVAVTGLLAATPVFAQSDQPIVATITVPVTIDFLDTEQMRPAPIVSCALYGGSGGAENIVASGTAAVPMVSTQATTTARSVSSFSGNVVVTVRTKSGNVGGSVLSGETAAQASARNALAAARSYQCMLGDGLSITGAGAGAGAKWTSSIMQGTKEVNPLKATLLVKGTITK